MTAAVATIPEKQPARAPLFAMSPQTLDEAMQFAEMISKSSIVPKDYQGNPGNILVAVQWGAEIGLAPLQAMQSIAVINGRPSIWGDAMLALVRGSGLLEFIREDPTDAGCTCTLKRRGEAEVVRTFTVEDAKKAQLWGKQGPWQTAPKRMLQMRARAFALRDVFPDVLRGVHVAEEAQDMPTERHMGQADEVKPDVPALADSRAAKVKAALAARKAGTTLHEALAEVMNAIGAADTMEALKATAEMASGLESDDDRKAARTAYKARSAEIKSAQAVDPDTGEIFDLAAAVEQMQSCTSRETLAELMDEFRSAPQSVQQQLAEAFARRDAELAQ